MLKRLTKATKPDHEYGFDARGKLIRVLTFDRDIDYANDPRGMRPQTEYLWREGNVEYGITFMYFMGKHTADFLGKCEFDEEGRITSYIFDIHSGSFRCEKFTYSNGQLQSSRMFDFFDMEDSDELLIFDSGTYDFEHDEEGYLTEYWYNGVENGVITERRLYKAYIKRKV